MRFFLTWMSRSSISLLLLLNSALPTFADLKAGSQTLSLGVGGGIQSGRYYDDYGFSSNDAGAGTLGVQYFVYLTQKSGFALGLEAMNTRTRTYTYHAPFAPQTRGDLRLTSYNLLGKLSFPNGVARPYLLVGGGPAFSTFAPDNAAASFNRHRSGGTAVFGTGLDLFFTEHLFLGLEYRNDWYFIPGHDSIAERTESIRAVRQFILRLGLKFGR